MCRLIPEKEDQQYEAAKAKVEIDHLNAMNEKLKAKMRELEGRLAVVRRFECVVRRFGWLRAQKDIYCIFVRS